ncbi:acetyltransferase [Paenibacillus albidus]|uniref:Acetyltransferase n=1 Tax=Paenibacillus albidus TaxID=2041023 RepID=A0A917D093_9BACL|nr:GNAT family N-acetyltransferase [Paenibacillus albidus]GGG05337.1 acetyltransferase [Paenibacillus albidus]
MIIRQLQAEEFEDSLSLSEYAFKYKMTSEDKEKAKERFKPERVWGIFEQEKLEAKLMIIPFRVNIQGRAIHMGGIAGVATWPENRRQGLVAKLLSHSLQTMNEAGQLLSFLHPFLIPFYRKFGWEVYCEYKKYSIPAANFPAKTEVEGSVIRDHSDIDELNGMYRMFAERYNGTLQRDKDWWTHTVMSEEDHHAVFYSHSGEPEGYVLYKIEKGELVIDELVHLTETARKGLWTFLANHDSMVTGAALKMVPSDDILPYLLPDPRIPQEIYPYFMARLVNAKAFVESYSFNVPSRLQKQKLYIEDKHAPWNNGLWEWSISEEGKGGLEQIAGEQAQADLICGIGTLTVLLMGYKRPEEMSRYGQLTGSETAIQWFEEIVPQATTALFDFF